LPAALSILSKLAAPLAIVTGVLTGLYWIANRFKEMEANQGKFRTNSLQNIQFTLESMKVIDDVNSKMMTSLHNLSFAFGKPLNL
jgi:hypothetical protein